MTNQIDAPKDQITSDPTDQVNASGDPMDQVKTAMALRDAMLGPIDISKDINFSTVQGMIASFMAYAEQPIRTVPTATIPEAERERIKRITGEEIRETFEAMDQGNLVEIADGIADSIYTLVAAAIAYGIYLPPIIREVCLNNQSKTLFPKVLKDGKLMKPPGHVPPRVWEILGLLSDAVPDLSVKVTLLILWDNSDDVSYIIETFPEAEADKIMSWSGGYYTSLDGDSSQVFDFYEARLDKWQPFDGCITDRVDAVVFLGQV